MVRYRSREKKNKSSFDRVRWVGIFLLVFCGLIVARLAHLQIFQYGFYAALAEDQHSLSERLMAERGEVFVRDGDTLIPIATNKEYFLVYAVPRNITEVGTAVDALAPLLELEKDELTARLEKPDDVYEPLKRQVEKSVVEQIKHLELEGIGYQRETYRYYPEKNIGSHMLGFVGIRDDQRVGQYGIEGYWDEQLSGTHGFIEADRDAGGRWISVGSKVLEEKTDGDALVLTIDRTVQYKACTALNAAVAKHGSTGGSLIIMEPATGKIIAMCGAPDFNPNTYNEVEDINVYVNPSTFGVYEPGSVFKPLTMAAALNEGKVTPTTTYEDTGSVEIGNFTIKNSDGKAHGVVTMTTVLEQSLNTGAIYAAEQIGPETFEKYIRNFGFGEKTGIEVDSEQAGDVSSLEEHKEIYMATNSFGQGLTTTPIQLVAAFGAIANNGVLMKPYIVDEIIHSDGTAVQREPEEVRQVISPETAAKVKAMLAKVVQNGHGQRAGVPGYFVGGKTGTAQIPLENKRGYDPNQTIGTFIGFAPVDNPRFVMLTRIDRPQDVQFAESSAAPLFGEVAKFMLQYFQVPPEVESEM